jgi:hypothetical protein
MSESVKMLFFVLQPPLLCLHVAVAAVDGDEVVMKNDFDMERNSNFVSRVHKTSCL